MKRRLFPAAAMALLCFSASSLHAQDRRPVKEDRKGASNPKAVTVRERSSLVINIDRHARSEGPRVGQPQAGNSSATPYHAPAYGRSKRSSPQQAPAAPHSQALLPAHSQPQPAEANSRFQAAHVVHRKAVEYGALQTNLLRIGVKSEPGFITDRSEMMLGRKDLAPRPRAGADGRPLHASPIASRNIYDGGARAHMQRIEQPGFLAGIVRANATEREQGRYYWHRGDGFTYGHYLDGNGYNWYGWYLGDQYFWTCDYHDRWWWFDDATGRWCFWNDNFWWWQDPSHVGDLYCYSGGSYIPCNSEDDEVAVSTPDTAQVKVFKSPDGSRIVKIFGEGKDAFLYDASIPARFDPVYLASGVEDVQFSTPRNGRPMQVVMKLDDGSVDVINAQQQSSASALPRSINSVQ